MFELFECNWQSISKLLGEEASSFSRLSLLQWVVNPASSGLPQQRTWYQAILKSFHSHDWLDEVDDDLLVQFFERLPDGSPGSYIVCKINVDKARKVSRKLSLKNRVKFLSCCGATGVSVVKENLEKGTLSVADVFDFSYNTTNFLVSFVDYLLDVSLFKFNQLPSALWDQVISNTSVLLKALQKAGPEDEVEKFVSTISLYRPWLQPNAFKIVDALFACVEPQFHSSEPMQRFVMWTLVNSFSAPEEQIKRLQSLLSSQPYSTSFSDVHELISDPNFGENSVTAICDLLVDHSALAHELGKGTIFQCVSSLVQQSNVSFVLMSRLVDKLDSSQLHEIVLSVPDEHKTKCLDTLTRHYSFFSTLVDKDSIIPWISSALWAKLVKDHCFYDDLLAHAPLEVLRDKFSLPPADEDETYYKEIMEEFHSLFLGELNKIPADRQPLFFQLYKDFNGSLRELVNCVNSVVD